MFAQTVVVGIVAFLYLKPYTVLVRHNLWSNVGDGCAGGKNTHIVSHDLRGDERGQLPLLL